MGPPNGDSRAARSGSTWIHWKSPVASANVSTCCWVISVQSLHPRWVPTAPRIASMPSNVVAAMSSPLGPLGAGRDDLPGQVAGVVAGQEHHDVGDLPRLGVAAERFALGEL